MIAEMIIGEIKALAEGISQKQLENKYFEALEKLPEEELIAVRDSFNEEPPVYYTMPDLDHLY